MSLLQETIVYIWLLPVIAQIVLPLGMLMIWSIKKVSVVRGKKSTVSIAGNELELPGSAT